MRKVAVMVIMAFFLAAQAWSDDPIKEIGQDFKKMGKKTGQAFKSGGKEVGHGIKEMGKETGQAAKKTGQSAGGWFREAGKKTGEAFRRMGRDIKRLFKGE